jgi:biopolymer transport protein ExbD
LDVAELEKISLSLGRRRRRSIRITFVPLVDCFIILLIFFMLQSSFVVPHGLDLHNEKKEQIKAGSSSAESSILYIELHKDGGPW